MWSREDRCIAIKVNISYTSYYIDSRAVGRQAVGRWSMTILNTVRWLRSCGHRILHILEGRISQERFYLRSVDLKWHDRLRLSWKVWTKFELSTVWHKWTAKLLYSRDRQKGGESINFPSLVFGRIIHTESSTLRCATSNFLTMRLCRWNGHGNMCNRINHFYPRDAMLARVFATATCLSVCPSVCLDVCHTPVLCLAERKQDREMYTIW